VPTVSRRSVAASEPYSLAGGAYCQSLDPEITPGLSSDGHIVRGTVRQWSAEREGRVVMDQQIVTAVVQKHQPCAEQSARVSANRKACLPERVHRAGLPQRSATGTLNSPLTC